MNWKDKNVLVVGLGRSGKAATELLEHAGAKVCLYDGNPDLDTSEIKQEIFLKDMDATRLKSMDCAVFSPGVPLSIPLVEELKEAGVKIIGEIELAYSFEKGKVIGITGTNGKTTTTSLVGEIMSAYNDETFVVGNIGVPYTTMVESSSEQSVTVAEISSFQLETAIDFHPTVSAILNITEDHLNRHKTMENYADAKVSITKNQNAEDVCVLNYEDKRLREYARIIPAHVLYFSSINPVPEGMYLTKDGDMVRMPQNEVVCNVKDVKLLGNHNYENYMAGMLMALSMGVPMDIVRDVVKNFAGVEHRTEFVKEIGGVTYYNDSKGTNPDAAIKAIQGMVRKTVLIGGGDDKGSSYDEWIQSFDGKVKKLILLGKTKYDIEKTARKCGFNDIVMVDTLEEAVKKAEELTEPGEAVLLSPACASWDMFDSYEQRGDLFKQYVRSLE